MSERWKPSATVAAVIEHDGRFLLVEEHTPEGLRLNNPAGHLDPGESLVDACAREAREETAHVFTPTHLVGVYMAKFHRPAREHHAAETFTYLRFAFGGQLGAFDPHQPLDNGIVRTVWMTPEEIRACPERHRSPMLQRCVDDFLAGQRFPLSLIYTHPSVTQP